MAGNTLTATARDPSPFRIAGSRRLGLSRRFLTALRRGSGLLIACALSVLAKSAYASTDEEATENHLSLQPYEAVYKTSTSGLSVKLRRSLVMDDNGDCRLTSEGSLLVAGISEVSVFTIDGAQLQPKSYVYQLSGPVSRRREVHFKEDTDVIRSLYKKEWYALPKTAGTLDRMSQQEQLRLTLLNDTNPRRDLSFKVADGRKVKDYRLLYRGEEKLETPMGWVNTLHFERKHRDPETTSSIWIAPDWDYLMVRTVHVDEGKKTQANLISAAIDGTAVSGGER